MTLAELLKDSKPGDVLTADQVNAIKRALRGDQGTSRQGVGAGGKSTTRDHAPNHRYTELLICTTANPSGNKSDFTEKQMKTDGTIETRPDGWTGTVATGPMLKPPSGAVFALRTLTHDGDEIFMSIVAQGSTSGPKALTGSGTTAATDTWNRETDNQAVTIDLATRDYYDTTGHHLYYFTRLFTFDSLGDLYSISVETRHTTDDAVTCT